MISSYHPVILEADDGVSNALANHRISQRDWPEPRCPVEALTPRIVLNIGPHQSRIVLDFALVVRFMPSCSFFVS